MIFPTTSGTFAQAQLQEARSRAQEARPRALEASLAQVQSRELGVFVSEIPSHGAPIAIKELAVGKSWAHFVAGGFEAPLFRADGVDNV